MLNSVNYHYNRLMFLYCSYGLVSWMPDLDSIKMLRRNKLYATEVKITSAKFFICTLGGYILEYYQTH